MLIANQFGSSISSGGTAEPCPSRPRPREQDTSGYRNSSLPVAQLVNSPAGTLQMIAFRRITGQPQRHVGLYPSHSAQTGHRNRCSAAIFELAAPDIVRQFRDAVRMRLTNYVKVEDVIGFQSGVRFEFPEPVAFRVLERKEVIHAAIDRVGRLRPRPETTGGRSVRWGSNCTLVPRAIFMYKPRLAFDAYPQYSDSSPNTRKRKLLSLTVIQAGNSPCKRPRNYGGPQSTRSTPHLRRARAENVDGPKLYYV